MKFPVILILASLAGALVCGQENPSDTVAQEQVDNAANPEAPAETTSEPAPVTTEASSDAVQTTLAADNSAENQAATPQKAEPSTTRSSIFRTAVTFLKNKIEETEKKIKTHVDRINEFKKLPDKIIKAFPFHN